jgi:hypothetical protein
MEEGVWSETEMGTPQGAVLSPLLANIYLHYVFDLWVQAWRNQHAQGDVVVVRYADDTILGFQVQAEADRFREDLRKRLGKFGLELHPDKTRQIEFGRHAERDRKQRGEGKPENFLYHAVPGNLDSQWPFRTRLTRLWRTQLLHRSQRHRCNWARMARLAARWLPQPRVLHPWPTARFAASHPR